MATYRWHERDFIDAVVARRGYRLTGNAGSRWVLSGQTEGLSWATALTPASGEDDASIVWRCADVRAGDDARRQLRVQRSQDGGSTTFGPAEGGLEGGLAGLAAAGVATAIGGLLRRRSARKASETVGVAESVRAPERAATPTGALGAGWSLLDPMGVIDDQLAPWFSDWPGAWWGPGDERAAAVDSVWLNQNGLEVSASRWWCSADALDQLIGLGGLLAVRVRAAG